MSEQQRVNLAQRTILIAVANDLAGIRDGIRAMQLHRDVSEDVVIDDCIEVIIGRISRLEVDE